MSPGSREVVVRLREAAETIARLRAGPNLRPAGYRSSMPDYVRDAVESYGYDRAESRPAIPSPREIDRMDEAFGWLPLIEDRDQRRLVLARAFRVRWAALRPRFGMLSIRRLRQLHDKGIADIVLAIERRRRG
ncbi:MAG: hypothetical protein GY791_08120 [Alphaproteobacteria bacterium]|nr:hypothetical protein [Alphaproteobacteria bacterium]